MSLVFYPREDDLNSASLEQRLEVLMEAAQKYKAAVLDAASKASEPNPLKRTSPKDVRYAFNWEEIAKVLREIREMPESAPSQKIEKAQKFTRLAEVYEVLRAAKMPKLEAVRIALVNEASQLQS